MATHIAFAMRLIPIPTHNRAMKSRLFPPGCVALVVNSQLFTPPAPCQTKKSIDFIRHVMDWDWYYTRPAPTAKKKDRSAVLSAKPERLTCCGRWLSRQPGKTG